ncbi:uncharacterized protein E0L32_006758 [Thyridium curvatum]|uniref:Uncharacterized protein n=1 Tax=Thyridium curvatum TaxID=1093900 RepID=A0A507B7Y4_9PEZI|nr:uncharacterized protein E0L32_006758 [Thyridium curvatum]TPX12878.1 hypothetical protein E0L32_006758 [Thyridium curvatum]
MEHFRELLTRVRARYNQDEKDLSDNVQAFLTCYKRQAQESHQMRELILSQARAVDPNIEEELRRDPQYVLETPISILLEGACLELAHEPQVVDETPLYPEPTNIWPTPLKSIRPSDVSKKSLDVMRKVSAGSR